MAANTDSSAWVIGILGLAAGVFIGARWVNTKKAFGGWQKARAGVPKAKADRSKAWGAFMLAFRSALLAVGLLVIYLVATSSMFRR